MPFSDDIPVARRQSADVSQNAGGSLRGLVWLGGGGLAAIAVAALWFVRPAAPTRTTSANEIEAAPVTADTPDEAETEAIAASLPASPSEAAAILGHFAFNETSPDNLVTIEGDLKLHANAARKYREMVAAARQDGISIVPISGFRSMELQDQLFFQRAQERALRPQERASVSAPPGFSEHHTGYAIDLGDANAPHATLSVTFEATPSFKWLQANAARFGFELSFPRDNDQGVSYEPWHWRFVGDRDSLATFYANRDAKPQAIQ